MAEEEETAELQKQESMRMAELQKQESMRMAELQKKEIIMMAAMERAKEEKEKKKRAYDHRKREVVQFQFIVPLREPQSSLYYCQ
jgi:hypothetical protein